MAWRSLLLIAILVPCQALALDGRLVYPDGTPVADATISILGESGTARTDRQGRFRWQPDPRPPFEIIVSLSSGEYLAPILVNSIPEEGPLVVEAVPVAEDSVTVAGGVTPHIEAPAVSATSLLSRRELELTRPARLADALETVAGVRQVSDGHAAVPAIRGLAGGRTLILLDGGRVTTERRAGPSATYLDPFFLESIEVARGPGSVAYGSDAIGGVIHARTRRVEPGSPFRFRARGTWAGGGSPERALGLEAAQGFADGGVLAQASYRMFEDFDSPLGAVDNSAARNRSLRVAANQEIGPGRLSVGWQSDLGRDVGRPRDNSDRTRFFYPREDSHRLSAAYEMDPGGGFSRVQLDFFLGRYRLVTTREELPRAGVVRSAETSDVSAGDFGLRFLAVRPLPRARLEVGVDVNGRFGLEALESTRQYDAADRLVAAGGEAAIVDASRYDRAVYASLEYLLAEAVTASGGVRFDSVVTRNRGGVFGELSTGNESLSGYGALSVKPWKSLKLTGQVSRGFRDPSLSDRYFAGVTGRGFIRGNPLLEPETSLQLDFAARYSAGRVQWAAYAYRYRLSDLVERFEATPDFFLFRNRGRAVIRGVELEADVGLTVRLHLRLAAQTSRGRSEPELEPLDNISVRSLDLSLRQALPRGLFWQLRGVLYGRDERPGPTERVTPGYGLVNLSAGWRIHRSFQLGFRLSNLLDKDYPLSQDRRSVLAAGRGASVSLTLEP